MLNPITKKDFFWGYLATALNVGAGLILLPILLRFLSPEDVGMWFVFLTLGSLAQLLEMGFQPTLARNAAYVFSGAQDLLKEGVSGGNFKEINYSLLSQLLAASRAVHRYIAFAAAIALLGVGSVYIVSVASPAQEFFPLLFAWITFALGYIVNFYYGYINGVLQGKGYLSDSNKVIVVTRSLMIIIGGASVILGLGLIGLGAASLAASMVGRFIAHHFFSRIPEISYIQNMPEKSSGTALIPILWHNSSKLGMVQIGAFMIQRGNILIASSFLGLAAAASYGMTVTLLITLSSVATMICQIQIPYMSSLQANGDKEKLRPVYGSILILCWSIYLVGCVFLLVAGDAVLDLIGSHARLLPTFPMFLLGVVLLLEMNHSVAATYLTTANNVPFVSSALISGGAVVVFSLITVKSLGIFGLIFAQGVVQLFYNNWIWPYRAIQDLNSSFGKVVRLGALKLLKG